MDIKTSNIVLDEQYNARLIDFGLAREMSQPHENKLETSHPVMGTAGYFPTQQFKYLTLDHDYHNFGVGKFYSILK